MDVKSFFRAVVGTFSTDMGIHTVTFVTTIFIVRNLSATDFGIFSLLMSFSLTLCYLSSVGLPQAIVYFIGKHEKPIGNLVGTYLSFLLFIGVTITGVAYFSRDLPLQSFLRDLPHDCFPLLLGVYFFTLVNTFVMSIFRGLKNFILFNFGRLMTPAVNILGLFAVYIIFGLSLRSIVFVFLAVSLIVSASLFAKVVSITSPRLDLNWATAVSFWKYGVKSYIQLLSGHLIYRLDLYILAYFTSTREVAFYSIAVSVATLLWYVPNTVGLVLLPTLSSSHNEKDIHLFSALVTRHTLLITTLGAIILGFIGKYLIVFLYGSEYAKSLNAMYLILPGVVMMSLYKVLTRNFSSRNRQQISIIAATIALILNTILNFAWIPRYGIEGAALASTISYAFAGLILVVRVRKESDIPIRRFLVVTWSDLKHYRQLNVKFRRNVFTTN